MPKKFIDALSDVGVRGAKPALRDGVPVDRKLHDGRGLYLLVRANGARHWRLKFYLAGRERLLALGEYPDVTLARARQKAGEARNLIREGIDPVQNGREQKALLVNAAQQTFAVIAEEWLGKKSKKWTEGHLEQNWTHSSRNADQQCHRPRCRGPRCFPCRSSRPSSAAPTCGSSSCRCSRLRLANDSPNAQCAWCGCPALADS